MTYEAEISFTLDTICPWTYLAKRRLEKALAQIPSPSPVHFTIKYKPYQLYPNASQNGEDKKAWYKTTRYGDSDEKMEMYEHVMQNFGRAEGINFKFGGLVANTLPAHRLIQHFQESRGPEIADGMVRSLYRQYFEGERHPSSDETLLAAAKEAGIEEADARRFLEDGDEGLADVKMMIREQAGNGIDSVPYIVFEGRRRDITLEGAKEVDEYVKTLNQIIKESS
ncbi:uncharacterized protein MYCFIDRAFT_26774 [Pseudocercospora fijiensis CIRAD86]|uniref:DSBA-like thioredoxin domain-containing protein n=1 Tax=Pseudocercospora fijiensis (strain CIRAD86) TaxID=383855 RepID=N1QBA4_PSEFD|nr:uncharacterized protein MYCFIDRAFT_26774 [Pseudocercospora fijiensis CIRAD86]EME88383.1 hypothetical protein MYCFIDRAFT_26774 [Pseudocercospora fijiensis CIRAD86]